MSSFILNICHQTEKETNRNRIQGYVAEPSDYVQNGQDVEVKRAKSCKTAHFYRTKLQGKCSE